MFKKLFTRKNEKNNSEKEVEEKTNLELEVDDAVKYATNLTPGTKEYIELMNGIKTGSEAIKFQSEAKAAIIKANSEAEAAKKKARSESKNFIVGIFGVIAVPILALVVELFNGRIGTKMMNWRSNWKM